MDQAGRILQVAIDDDHGVTLGVVQACAKGGLVPEIPAEVDNFVVGVSGQEAFQDFPGAVLGTVVHENQFVFDGLEFLFQNAVSLRDDFFFVVNGNDDGQ